MAGDRQAIREFLEKQLAHRREKLVEYLEAAMEAKSRAEGLQEDIEEARAGGLPSSLIEKLEARLAEKIRANQDAVDKVKRLQAQIAEDEDFLAKEFGREEG